MANAENKDRLPVKELSQGHRTNVNKAELGEFMCPECNKTFSSKDRAEEHLHAEHSKHLTAVHTEFHEKDTGHKHGE